MKKWIKRVCIVCFAILCCIVQLKPYNVIAKTNLKKINTRKIKIEQPIVFIDVYTNYAYGYQRYGSYITNTGKKIAFDFSSYNYGDKEGESMEDLLLLLEEQNTSDSISEKFMSKKEMKQYYYVLNHLKKKIKYKTKRYAVDMGTRCLYGVYYDKKGNPKFVLLDQTGDVIKTCKDKDVKLIVKRLQKEPS